MNRAGNSNAVQAEPVPSDALQAEPLQAEASQADSATPPAAAKAPTLVRPTPDRAWRRLVEVAQGRYRECGRFAWSFAGGKLGWDPVFRHVLEQGHIPARSRVVDIGCGQALLASLLAAVDDAHRHAGWPSEWAPPPVDCSYVGIELMRRDVERAHTALAALQDRVRVVCADMVEAELPACDVVVILDVLHYVTQPKQEDLLARLHRQLDPGGRLLLRIGDKSARRGFAASQWADRIITSVRGHRVAPTFCRPMADWVALLGQVGFVRVRSIPMSRGTPFANVLLVADKP